MLLFFKPKELFETQGVLKPMELFETQGILKPMELLKQGVFCPSEIDGTDGILPFFFAKKGIPLVFDSIGF